MARQEKPPMHRSLQEARLSLHVQAGAKSTHVLGVENGVLRVRVATPAHEGRANQALIDHLASLLSIPKTRIRILRGFTGRSKVVVVEGLSQEETLRKLGVA